MKGYVYKLTSPNLKSYIGITNNFRRRIAEHKRLSKEISNRKIYTAIRKYGFENFNIEILETHESKNGTELLEKLNQREIYFISKYDTFKNGYNCTLGGDGTKGLNGELNPFYNKTHTKESKIKMSNAHKGKKLSAEHRKKIGEKGIGKLHTKESKEKMCKVQRELNGKKVLCVDTGVEYECIADCSNATGINRSDIRKVCRGERVKAKGFSFRFMKDGSVIEVNPIDNSKKKIMCIETLEEFESIQSACDKMGVRHQHVSAVLRGKQKTTKGYSFKYL